MVLNRQRHTDERHRGDAGRNEPGGLAGLDDNAELTAAAFPASIRANIALNAFRIAINGSLTRFNLQDGVIDDFQDDSGILSGGNYSSGKITMNEYASVDTDATQTSTQSTDTPGVLAYTYVAAATGAHKIEYEMSCSEIGRAGVYRTVNDANQTSLGSNTTAGTFIVYTNNVELNQGDTLKIYVRVNNPAFTVYIKNFETFRSPVIVSVIGVKSVAESQPTNLRVVILADDAAMTLNTDLKFYASVDDGVTWEQIALEDNGDYSATAIILTGSVAVAGTGTDIKYKIECTQADYEIYAVGLLWD